MQKAVVGYLEICMQLIIEKEDYEISGNDVKLCPLKNTLIFLIPLQKILASLAMYT